MLGGGPGRAVCLCTRVCARVLVRGSECVKGRDLQASASSSTSSSWWTWPKGACALVNLRGLCKKPGGASVGVGVRCVWRQGTRYRRAGTPGPQHACQPSRDMCVWLPPCRRWGLRLIQVLPVNDTCVYGTWWDSYPYSTMSVFALHPQVCELAARMHACESACMRAGVCAQQHMPVCMQA